MSFRGRGRSIQVEGAPQRNSNDTNGALGQRWRRFKILFILTHPLPTLFSLSLFLSFCFSIFQLYSPHTITLSIPLYLFFFFFFQFSLFERVRGPKMRYLNVKVLWIFKLCPYSTLSWIKTKKKKSNYFYLCLFSTKINPTPLTYNLDFEVFRVHALEQLKIKIKMTVLQQLTQEEVD